MANRARRRLGCRAVFTILVWAIMSPSSTKSVAQQLSDDGGHDCLLDLDRKSLRKRFYLSEISRFNSTQVVTWMKECAGVYIPELIAHAQASQDDLSGLALWEVCVVQKEQFLQNLKIDTRSKKLIISAFCKEIQGDSCWSNFQKADDENSGTESEKHKESESLLSLRDRDGDHRLSQAEILMGSAVVNTQADKLFKSFDSDGDGYLSRKELSRLKSAFFRSKLSHLSGQEVQQWLMDPRCVASAEKISQRIHSLDTSELSGLALWDFAILRPKQLAEALGIDDPQMQLMIQVAVLREIHGKHGCLSENQWGTKIFEGRFSILLLMAGVSIKLWSFFTQKKTTTSIEISDETFARADEPAMKRSTWPIRKGSAKKRVRFLTDDENQSAHDNVRWVVVVFCGGLPLISRLCENIFDWALTWYAEVSLSSIGFVIASSCLLQFVMVRRQSALALKAK